LDWRQDRDCALTTTEASLRHHNFGRAGAVEGVCEWLSYRFPPRRWCIPRLANPAFLLEIEAAAAPC
jgi:hypothetical protein